MSQTETLPITRPDPEVRQKAKRRQFTTEYKKRILDEADACDTPAERGALVRREGLYSSHLNAWRRQRDQGILDDLDSKKRGPKRDPLAVENARLQRENERLQRQLQRAEKIMRFKKSLATPGNTAGGESTRRRELIQAIKTKAPTMGIATACEASMLSRSSYYRALQPIVPPVALVSQAQVSPRALTPAEKSQVRETLNSERFQDRHPARSMQPC